MKSIKQYIKEFKNELLYQPFDELKDLEELTNQQIDALTRILIEHGYSFINKIRDDITSTLVFKNSIDNAISIRLCFIDSVMPSEFELPAMFVLDCKCSKGIAIASEIIFDNMEFYDKILKPIAFSRKNNIMTHFSIINDIYSSNVDMLKDYLNV